MEDNNSDKKTVLPLENSRRLPASGIISGVLLLSLIGLGFLYYQAKQQLDMTNRQVKLTQQRLKELESKSVIDTSAWKTYRNNQYKFQIKYPEETEFNLGEVISWNSSMKIQCATLFDNSTISVGVGGSTLCFIYGSLEDYLASELKFFKSAKIQDIEIAGRLAKKFSLAFGVSQRSNALSYSENYFVKLADGVTLKIGFRASDGQQDGNGHWQSDGKHEVPTLNYIYSAILSSIKFTD